MKTEVSLSQKLKKLKKEYKRIFIRLRRVERTKMACEDAGYLQYYPYLLTDISNLKDNKSIIRKDIRIYSQLLKRETKSVN
jgi:hypothetical protein